MISGWVWTSASHQRLLPACPPASGARARGAPRVACCRHQRRLLGGNGTCAAGFMALVGLGSVGPCTAGAPHALTQAVPASPADHRDRGARPAGAGAVQDVHHGCSEERAHGCCSIHRRAAVGACCPPTCRGAAAGHVQHSLGPRPPLCLPATPSLPPRMPPGWICNHSRRCPALPSPAQLCPPTLARPLTPKHTHTLPAPCHPQAGGAPGGGADQAARGHRLIRVGAQTGG